MKIKYVVVIVCQTCFLLAQTPPASPAGSDNLMWQPTAELNKELPAWLQFNGSYRMRVEDQSGIGFKDVSDTHALGQFQFGVKVQPFDWLSFYGQTQDARMYWNGPVAKAPPYQNTWDV